MSAATDLEFLIYTLQSINGGMKISNFVLAHLDLLLEIRDLAQVGLVFRCILGF